MKVLLVIPAYNEEENILRVVETINAYRQRELRYELDYIVINDGSKDGTALVCDNNNINTVHLIQNLGIAGAVQTGCMLAQIQGFDIAVQFDGDGQHDIESLDALLRPILDGEADFVIGSRFLAESESEFTSTRLRRVGIVLLQAIIRLCSGYKLSDPTSGYRAASRSVFELPVEITEPESLVEIKKAGFRLAEAPVNMLERIAGTSSIHSWKSAYFMIKASIAIFCVSLQRQVK